MVHVLSKIPGSFSQSLLITKPFVSKGVLPLLEYGFYSWQTIEEASPYAKNSLLLHLDLLHVHEE
jgi:hypothetical protein